MSDDHPTGRRRRRNISLGRSHTEKDVDGSHIPDRDRDDEDEDLMEVTEPDIDNIVATRSKRDKATTPKDRIKDVRKSASQYEREYRLLLTHRLLMRGIALDKIAEELDVSIHTVKKDRKELHRRLKRAAKRLDIHLLIGDTMGFYKEVQAMTMRTASSNQIPMRIRLASLRTALSARNDQTRFLAAAGVFDALPFKPENEQSSTDIDKLMAITKDLLSDDEVVQAVSEETGHIPESELFDLDEESEENLLL